jgi:ribose 5-phosphate isomerase A
MIEKYKQQAAERAVDFVCSGMIVGLGSGSTAVYATRRLAQLLRDGMLHDVVGVPTSAATAAAAEQLRIPLLAWPYPLKWCASAGAARPNTSAVLGADATLRGLPGDAPFVTDQGNLILDCAFGPIADPARLGVRIRARAGVVEHGLFVGLTSDLIVAGADGLRHLLPPGN